MKKLTQEEAEQRLNELGVIFEPFTYDGNRTFINYNCHMCNQITSKKYYKIVRGEIVCQKCGFVKTQNTCMEKYGYKTSFQCPRIKEKIKQSNLSSFGVEHPTQCQTIMGKITSKLTKTKKKFLKECYEVHGDKYDYSKTKYVTAHKNVDIICEKHGLFKQTPNNHIRGAGCPECALEETSKQRSLNLTDFVNRCNYTHDYKYIYSKVDYVNSKTKVYIICPEHGEFWQTPSDHLYNKCGCSKCKESKIEKDVRIYLQCNRVNYNYEDKFNWLVNPTTKKKLSLDFYLPDYNIAIECQGIQHFEKMRWFGSNDKSKIDETFEKLQYRDEIKKQLCQENGVRLYYINYNDNTEDQLNKIMKENNIVIYNYKKKR